MKKSSNREIGAYNNTQKDLIEYLITDGLIDKSYTLYISNFHEGQISKNDMRYVQKVLVDSFVGYSTNLEKPEEVAKYFIKSEYKGKGWLNIELLNYLYKNNQSTYDIIISLINNENEYRFIKYYFDNTSGPNSQLILQDIIGQWNKDYFEKYLKSNTNDPSYNVFFEIALKYDENRLFPIDNKEVNEYFSSNYNLISEIYYAIKDRFSLYLRSGNIRFNFINRENKELFNAVIKGCYFKLSSDNIKIILDSDSVVRKYNTAAYTTIAEHGGSTLQEYVNDNLEYCINSVFPETSISESPESLIYIINDKDIDTTTKVSYLKKQRHNLSNKSIEYKLYSLIDILPKYYDILLENDLIEAKWEPVALYNNNFGINDKIVKFLEFNISQLGSCNDSEIDDKEIVELFNALILSDTIANLELYKNLCNKFDCNISNYQIDNLSSDKIEFLITSKKLEFNAQYFQWLSDHSSSLLSLYVIVNIKHYMSDINSLGINLGLLVSILNSKKVDEVDKTIIIERVNSKLLFTNTMIADDVISVLCSSNSNKLEDSVLIGLIGKSTKNQALLQFAVQILQSRSYDEDFIDSILTAMGYEYAKISAKERMAKFEPNKENEYITSFLWENRHRNLSSEPRLHKGYIKVHMKRS